MKNDLPPVLSNEDLERDAYNAAFHELGLRWYWDSETYEALMRHSAEPELRIRHYLETQQPHLLKAYDAGFLASAIQERMLQHKPCELGPFNWAQASTAWELGV